MPRTTKFDKEWNQLIDRVFPSQVVPDSAEWTELEDVLSVLQKICEFSGSHHLFLPASGGADLQAVKKANEHGCLVLDLGGALHVLQPKSLQFEGFFLDRQACFFRLWNRQLRPFQNDELERETLIALENGQYRSLEDEYDYDEDPGNRLAEMDDDALHAVLAKMKGEEVDRWQQEVSFVVFSKGSYYNDSVESYCGLQAGRSRLEFRQFISSKYSEK